MNKALWTMLSLAAMCPSECRQHRFPKPIKKADIGKRRKRRRVEKSRKNNRKG